MKHSSANSFATPAIPSFTNRSTLFTTSSVSSSSTSSISSFMSSVVGENNNNDNSNNTTSHSTNTTTMAMNPFEETNKFRLEQSVLSPNLFHVASTSTPERDTTSLWNIDQRAVLYPADIPTDETSLLAQYLYDNKLNKQMSAAVEAFWTQNKVNRANSISKYWSHKLKI